MADEVVVEAPVAIEEAPVVVQPAADPADLEEPVVKTGAKTIDSHEVSVGWTAQQGGIPSEPEPVPGTVVTYAELPYEASLVAAGIDVEQYHANLDPAVVADEAERDAVRGVGTVPTGVPVAVPEDAPAVFVVPEVAPGDAPVVVPEVAP